METESNLVVFGAGSREKEERLLIGLDFLYGVKKKKRKSNPEIR